MAQSRQRSRLPRNLLIGFLVLVVLYTLAGFLLLPWWLERTLPDQLQQRMGWQTTVTGIRTNPFALSVEAVDLSALDSGGEKVIGFDRFYLDLGFFQLFRGIVGFQNIQLDEPFIRVDLLEDSTVNFARDWQAHNAVTDAAETPAPAADGAPPKLYFRRVALSGGELLFRDFTGAEPADFRVTPLDLTLTDLATFSRDGQNSDYVVNAALGAQTIQWQGNLSVTPLESSGFLSIANVDYLTLGHFLQPYLPYELAGGTVSLATDYDFAMADGVQLETSAGVINVRDLALAVAGDSDGQPPELRAAAIDLEQLGFSLAGREARVGRVGASGLAIDLLRDKNGQINLVTPLQAADAGSDAGDDDTGAAATTPFRWTVAAVELTDSNVGWRDEALPEPADLRLEALQLTLGTLSDRLEEPVPYSLQAGLASGGRLQADGRVTLAPFTLESGLAVSAVTLAAFEPYLKTATNLEVRKGQLTLDGNLDLDGQKDPLTGTFSGTGEIAGLDLGLAGSDEPLLAWQALRLAPIEYNVAPARLEIGTVTLAGAAANVVRSVEGVHNVERIVRESAAGENAQGAPSETGEAGLIFRIGEVILENSGVNYTDRSLSPVFATRFGELNGSVTGLSNISPQQGRVAIQGRVGDLSRLSFDGSIGTLGTEDSSELVIRLQDLSLPTLSPYFGRYLGYGVDGGKLALNLDYKIAGSRIDATNLVVMDRLELGQTVPSDEAVNAPVKLGLALLRDSDGIIEIDLPVSGDLNDPEFSVGRVVMRAFVNLLAKAAMSPFSMLGSIADMAGLSGEELGQVSFAPGAEALSGEQAGKLDVLARALSERPELLLNVRGAVVPELDGAALRQQQLNRRLGLDGSETQAARIRRLEQAVADSGVAVAPLREQAVARQGGELSDSQWQATLYRQLTAELALPPEALGNLAVARGLWLQRSLLDDHDIPASQLFLLDPQLNGAPSGDGQVVVQFTLDAR